MTKRIVIKYSKNGNCVSDFELDNWLNSLVNKFNKSNSSITVDICNETAVEYSILLITRGTIKFNEMVLEVDGRILHFNEFASIIEKCPDGFLTIGTNTVFERSKYSIKLRENKRSKRNG